MSICDAINNRQLLRFTYHGHARIVQPHTYGIDTKGHKTLRAYQTGGTSGSGRIPDWRIFHESHMRALSVLTEQFSSPAPDYARGDQAFATIWCQL